MRIGYPGNGIGRYVGTTPPLPVGSLGYSEDSHTGWHPAVQVAGAEKIFVNNPPSFCKGLVSRPFTFFV